jgi:hypothetical protein
MDTEQQQQQPHYSSYPTQEWEDDESDFMNVDDASGDDDDNSTDFDGDIIDKEIDDEYEAAGSDADEDDWHSFFYFVILSQDEQGRPIVDSRPLTYSGPGMNSGVDDIRGSRENTPSTAQFAGKIRHYLTYNRTPGLGPYDFVYYLDGKRYDPRDPDHDQPLTKRTYSDELIAQCDRVYGKQQGKKKNKYNPLKLADMGEKYGWVGESGNIRHFPVVVVHRDSSLVPDDISFPKVHLADETLDNLKLTTTLLIDIHERIEEVQIRPRFDFDDCFGKLDFPMLFMGWKYTKSGAIRLAHNLLRPDWDEWSDVQ